MGELQEAINKALMKGLGFETPEEFEEYQIRFTRHSELIERLREDWCYADEQLGFDEDDQFYRRTLVRTLFAMVEGAVFALKQEALEQYRIGKLELSPGEHAMLSEVSYSLKKSGAVNESSCYPKLIANIKFTFPICARAWGTLFEFDPPLSKEPKWGKFCQAIEIRNRLMHPKSLEDLEVQDSDLTDVLDAASWFSEQLDRLDQITLEVLKQLLSHAEVGKPNDTTQPDLGARETACQDADSSRFL